METPDLYWYEAAAREEGFCCICGVDEAGRGPLAGPVTAAAVVLPEGVEIPGINDSKKLTEAKREALFPAICEKALAWSVAFASHEEIDSYNILQATFLAMRRAVKGLSILPQLALVDGNRDPGLELSTRCIVKGDSHCASIAAASILAKVSRDRRMVELDRQYPQYGFAKHKGYPTKAHYEALASFGPSPVHRRSFLKNRPELLGRNPTIDQGLQR